MSGITYSGRAADTWAVGVTLYCMILGQYPFLADTLQDTYDKVGSAADQCYPWILKNIFENLITFHGL